MSKLFLVSVFLLQFGCDHPESKEYNERIEHISTTPSISEKSDLENGYKVVGVKDGDTFVLLMDGKEEVIRFAHIDCPEKKQPYGNKAKKFVSELCFGKFVTLIHNNKFDRNKRLIAEVILEDGNNLNKELIKNGLAWHFKKYSTDRVYAELELKARQNKIGLWSETDPIAPWEWRK